MMTKIMILVKTLLREIASYQAEAVLCPSNIYPSREIILSEALGLMLLTKRRLLMTGENANMQLFFLNFNFGDLEAVI